MENYTLKPCPFCGGIGNIDCEKNSCITKEIICFNCTVKCSSCGATCGINYDKDWRSLAVKRWNKRRTAP